MKERGLRSLGPAIIIGAVVLGPGSILTSSRVGCDFGYDLAWIVAGSTLLMIAMTALSARLGATLEGTPCEELRRRAGGAFSVLVGLVLFLIVACFQFGNNIGVLAALTPFVEGSGAWTIVTLVALNACVALAIFGVRRLYRPLEVLMKLLVVLMIAGFLGNFVLAAPSLPRLAAGLVPELPDVIDVAVPALVGTTFSVAGAFYQAYLVRKKGWSEPDLDRGFVDSLVGISILGMLTLVILATAAATLHGRVQGSELRSAADVALVLEPLFGSGAKVMFCTGLLAGAFSSFLVNVMIGGTILSDSLGLGGDMDQRWPRTFTVIALLAGMIVGVWVESTGSSPVRLVIFAQSLTVLGNPLLAGVLLWLSFRARTVPRWIHVLAMAGFVVVLLLAFHTARRLLYGA